MFLIKLLLPICAFIFGSLIGSFLNVCIVRIPKGESIVRPPSHCPSCNKAIAWYDNIPILSYLVLMGKCRSCGGRISVVYPLVELATALVSLILFIKFGPSLEYLYIFILWSLLAIVTVIDLRFRIIPDVITLPGIVVGLGFSLLLQRLSFVDSIIGAVAGGGVLFLVGISYYAIRKKEGMGGGDVKLLAMIGAFLGWRSLLMILFVSSVFGSVVGIGFILFARKDRSFPIPFGPFLAFGALAYVIWGQQFTEMFLFPVR